MENNPSIKQLLHEKSEDLVPRQDYEKGKRVANIIFEIIKRHLVGVNRTFIAGSIGKRTAIDCGPDFDLVIFLNNKKPPFHDILNEIKDILKDNKLELPKYKYNWIAKTGMYISFEVSGMKFELLPAMNFGKSIQHYETFLQIKSLPQPEKEGFLWSPGLAESAVVFLKSQSAFCHSVIRLAKFWNANVDTQGYIRGRSSIIELVAIKSCEEVGHNDLHDAFKRFLENMANLINLKTYFNRFYKTEEIPRKILHNVKPIIMDPINYYNNMGYVLAVSPGSPTPQTEILMSTAKEALQKLEKWNNNPDARERSFRKIFR